METAETSLDRIMKSFQTTILLGLVFAVLGTYIYFVEVPSIEIEEAQEQELQRILPFDDREVIKLTFRSRDETIEMVRDDYYRWMIQKPIVTKGDSRTVQNLLRAITIGKVLRTIQEDGQVSSQSLSQYGLAPPYTTLSLHTTSQAETLSLGDVDPISSNLYAQRASDGKVLLTTLSVKDFRKKTLYTFRRKELFSFDRNMVKEFQVQHGSETLILYQTPSAHGASGNWRFRSPVDTPADKTAVGMLLMALEDLQAIGFIDTGPEHQKLLGQFTDPVTTLSVHFGNKKQSASFFRLNSGNSAAYAIRNREGPIYRINPSILRALPKGQFDLQDKRLFGMEVNDIGLLKVKTKTRTFMLIQQHQKWILENQPESAVNQQVANLFVSRVMDLPAELRAESEENNLDHYGLSNPHVEIIGIDQQGQTGGRLLLGKRESGLVYALGKGLPGVYQTRSQILSQIPSDLEFLNTPN